jgi:hypothetical protein
MPFCELRVSAITSSAPSDVLNNLIRVASASNQLFLYLSKISTDDEAQPGWNGTSPSSNT